MHIEIKDNSEKLIQGIVAQDLLVAKAAIDGLDDPIRSNIDARRKLLASLERELMARTGREYVDVFDYYSPSTEIGDFINLWCDLVKKIPHESDFLSDPAYCDRILDCYLPKVWNWDADLVVLVHPPCRTIVDRLVERGQKNIALYLDKSVNIELSDIKETTATIVSADEERALAERFSRLQNRVRHVTTIHCCPEKDNYQELSETVRSALKLGRKIGQISVNTRARFSNSWATNLIINMPKMAKLGQLADIKVEGIENAVVVAPGPSLEKNIHLLRDHQEQFFITAPLRAAGVLERHGVRPDLLIQIDALSKSEASHFRKNMPKNIENLLLEGSVNPVFFELETKNTAWTVIQRIDGFHKIFNSEPTPFRAPSVAMYAACYCYDLGFKSICLLGQDLATDGRTLYADGATEYLAPGGSLEGFNISVPGFWGEPVMTRDDFAYYLEQYAMLTKKWKLDKPALKLANCTEGGAFIEGFDHSKFADYVKQVNASGQLKKKTIHFMTASPNFEVEARNYLTKLGLQLDSAHSLAKKIIKLEESASRDQKVAKKREKLLKKFKDLSRRTELLELKMQKELTETVGSAQTTSSIPSYSDFFEKVVIAIDDLDKAIKLSKASPKPNDKNGRKS